MEIRIPNGRSSEQVFRAETTERMIEVLTKAQTNATKKIRQQAQHIEMLTNLIAHTLASTVADKLAEKQKDESQSSDS